MALTDAPQEPTPKPKSGVRTLLPYTTIALVIAMIYAGWTLYSRHESTRRMMEQNAAKRKEAQQDQYHTIFGSGEIRFTTFYASAGVLRPGQTAQLCYGALNATTLKLDPAPSEPVKPTARHCVDIAPKTTTTYTLTAGDGKGNTKTQSLTVQVK